MGIMTAYKIIDFCAQKSIEIVGIHSVEAERKAWHGSIYVYQCIYYPVCICAAGLSVWFCPHVYLLCVLVDGMYWQ